MLVANIVSFSSTIGIGTLLLAGALAVAGFVATRRDKRYEIAAGERDEWREKSDRLEKDLHKLDTRHQEMVHALELKVTELEGEIKVLLERPNVDKLYDLIERHDERSLTAWSDMQATSSQTLEVLTELVALARAA